MNEIKMKWRNIMEDKVKEILCNITGNNTYMQTLTGDYSIVEDTSIDSLQMINFILQIEEEFEIEVDFDEFDFDILKSSIRFCDYINKQR